jgi:hypothetical protein
MGGSLCSLHTKQTVLAMHAEAQRAYFETWVLLFMRVWAQPDAAQKNNT